MNGDFRSASEKPGHASRDSVAAFDENADHLRFTIRRRLRGAVHDGLKSLTTIDGILTQKLPIRITLQTLDQGRANTITQPAKPRLR